MPRNANPWAPLLTDYAVSALRPDSGGRGFPRRTGGQELGHHPLWFVGAVGVGEGLDAGGDGFAERQCLPGRDQRFLRTYRSWAAGENVRQAGLDRLIQVIRRG